MSGKQSAAQSNTAANQPGVAHARPGLARARSGSNDRAGSEDIHELLQRARETATELGMAPLLDRVRAVQCELGGSAEKRDLPCEIHRFRRDGDFWTLHYGDRRLQLKHQKGLRYLACLLASPGEEIHAAELIALTHRSPDPDASPRASALDGGAILDREAKRSYRRRLDDLRAERSLLRKRRQPVENVEAEIAFLEAELNRAVGLSGRDRTLGSNSERARVSVTLNLRSAIANIAKLDSGLGTHLTSSVRTGSFVSYSPAPELSIAWDI